MKSLQTVANLTGTEILAYLCSAELCECDMATATVEAEDEVIFQLEKFTSSGMAANRKSQEKKYYRLKSDIARRSIKRTVGALC